MPNKKRRRAKDARGKSWQTDNRATFWRRLGGLGFLVLGLLLVLLFFLRTRPPSQSQVKIWNEFSGLRALNYVQAVVGLGPRPPGSDAIKKARAYIRQNLSATGWLVEEQSFIDETPRGRVSFVNLIAHRPNESAERRRFFVASHYDTKTFDSFQFVGANDGGSSTGALLELARVLNQHPDFAAQIELIFFDGEEAYENFSITDGLYGSRYFAKKVQAKKKVETYRGGILWDMIGDRDLTITLPLDSPAELAKGIFDSADALQVRKHFTYFNDRMIDDHSPLNVVGVPTIDLIDFDYPPWHTAGDTMDKLSAQSLQTVGAVTLYYLANFALR